MSENKEKAKEILRLYFGSHYENTFIEPEDEECTVNAMNEFVSSEVAQYKEALDVCIETLRNISDPIEYLRKKAIKEKYSFDLRGAVEFTNNGMSVSCMATEVLEKLKAKQLLNNE